MCSLPFSRMFRVTMTVLLVLQAGIVSGENLGLHEVPEAFPTSSEGQSGLPLQKTPVKPQGYASGTFSHSWDPLRVTENTSFVTGDKQKQNQRDSKIVATSTTRGSSAFKKLANFTRSRRIQLNYVTKRNEEKFTDQILPEYDKTVRILSDNETNNHNLKQAGFNFGKLLNRQENVIQNSIMRNEENENKISPFKYIRLVRLEDNTRCKNKFRGTNHVHEREHIEETNNAEIDTADRIDDKRELDVISPQGRVNAWNSKGSLSRSSLGDNFSKISGSQLYVNIKRFIMESKARVDRARGQSRIRRGFHFHYGHQDVNDIPQASSGTSDSRTSLGDTPLMKVEKPYLIKPSFDSTALNELAILKLRILSERLTSPRRYASREYSPTGPQSSPTEPQRLRPRPSDLLSLIRNLPNFDQDQVAKHKLDAAFDRPVLQLSQNQLGKHDFNFPNIGYLSEKYFAQTKRDFDSIGEGVLSGMKQNHVGKRYASLFSSRSDSSRNRNIHPLGLYVQPDVTSETTLDTLNNDVDNWQYDIHLQDSVPDSVLSSFYDTTKRNRGPTNNFGSVNDWIVEAIRQYFNVNNELDYLKGMTTSDENVNFQEKRLDAISNGALGGMRQNFLDKKHFQSHPKESLPELLKNFLPNKYPRGTESEVNGDYSKNVVSKTKFNKFTTQRTRWRLNMNYDNGRKISQSYKNANSKPKHSFPKKRNNDLKFSSYDDRINQKVLEPVHVLDKRVPDSLSTNTMNDIGQIYVGQNNINSNKALSKLYDLYIHLLTKIDFALGENHFLSSLDNADIYPSADFKSDDQLRFAHKRDADTFEDSEFSADYLTSRNISQASHPLEKVTPFFTTFIETGPKANRRSVGSIPVNGLSQAEENLPNLGKDFPEKRSFDAIESISPISGLAQNFIETTKTQRQRIGFLPWSKFSKRNLDMYSSAVREEKDTDDHYRHYLDLLSTGFSPRTSAEVDNQQAYERNLLFSDQTRLNHFLNKIHESSKYKFHDLDTNESVYEFKDGDEPLHFSDTLKKHNSRKQDLAAEINGVIRHDNRK